MPTWTEQAYRVTMAMAAPLARLWLASGSRHGPLYGRFWLPPGEVAPGGIWFHACSLGEVNTARPLLVAAEKRWPDIPVMLSSSTFTGYSRAVEVAGADRARWFPFDDPASVRRFFDTAAPRAVALVETEIWPGFLAGAEQRGVPVVILNGRISDRAFPRFRRFASIFHPAFRRITLVAAQNEEYADRFIELGVPEERVRVTGSLKFDAVQLEPDPARRDYLRTCLGLVGDPPARVVVFGSTRPGDEALAATCLERLRPQFPDVHWIIAPRHVDRAGEVESLLRPFGVVRLSVLKRGETTPARVVLADTVGDLVGLYSLATVAVIGGSFYPGVEGHNPLESAALGIPTIYGPFMRNFPDAASALEKVGGALRLSAPDQLAETLKRLLSDPMKREVMGMSARQAVLAGRGALQRNLDCLDEATRAVPGTTHEA
ncbi:MAG TPA: 3-deoxy-D-manno-octulosonic acid transferase [Candidatus Hydrogenedentes bacterium]|nr:3-deoxy-D-manno-octulosonic acid transferase [Candidatus Hydrogenedentota bacterium]